MNLDPLNELLNKRVVSAPEQNAFRYANESLADRKKKNGDCVPYLGDAWVAAAKVVSPVVHPVLLRRRAVLA